MTVPAGADIGYRDLIRDVEDFPEPGVTFKDITPLLADPAAFAQVIEAMCEPWSEAGVDQVVGMEARGFIFAAPVAVRLGAGFVPARKAGKLPSEIERVEYELEYGTDLLEIHRDAFGPGQRVLVVDDVLATGGTAAAAGRLVSSLHADLVGFSFLVELGFLDGRSRLEGHDVVSLLTYD